LHIDACQAPRFLDINVARLGVDLMTLNGSKIYGPKGVGCLYVRRGIKLNPILLGGNQERGLRSGTENVPAIVGFAEALALCEELREKESTRLSKLRDELIAGLLKINGTKLNGHATDRLPNNVNIALPLLEPEQWVIELDAKGIACSAGSACSSNKNDSHDIMGVRFSLGREITKTEISYIIKTVSLILKKYARNSFT
jgi:cysteine desulfurase